MKSVFKTVAIGAVGGALAVAWLIMRPSPLGENVTLPATTSAAALPLPSASPTLPRPAASVPQPPMARDLGQLPSVTRGLEDEFARAENFRSFADFALKSPEKGGAFFASTALHICGAFRDGIPAISGASQSHAEVQRADAARAQLAYKCNQLLEAETSVSGAISVTKTGADPVLNSIQKTKAYSSSGGVEGRRDAEQALNRVVQIGSSMAIERALIVPSMNNGGPAFYFDGKYYPFTAAGNSAESRDVYLGSVRLAACQFSSTCDTMTVDAVFNCAMAGQCPSNQRDWVNRSIAEVPGSTEATRMAVDALASKMLVALRSGNMALFLPPARN